MGCHFSSSPRRTESVWDTRELGSCVIEVVRASNLPNMDIVSLTDCYVVFSFREVREVGETIKLRKSPWEAYHIEL